MAKKKAAKKKEALACPHCGHAHTEGQVQNFYERSGRMQHFRMVCLNRECGRIVQVHATLTPAFTIAKAKGSA